MSPDIADNIESLDNVYGLIKISKKFVVPLSEEECNGIQQLRNFSTVQLNENILKMKKDEYVTVIDGPLKGRYGILTGLKNGKLEV